MKFPKYIPEVREEPKAVTPERLAEHRKYAAVYTNANYRMHGSRQDNAQEDLRSVPCRDSYLDVGCGRGQMLDFAESIGFTEVKGTEVVPYLIDGTRVVYAEAHALPFADKSFDVVSSYDVLEHLIPGDDEAMCKEMHRVARSHIIVSANNCSSHGLNGEELHINKRPYDEWDRLLREWFPDCTVTWIPTSAQHSTERWRVDL